LLTGQEDKSGTSMLARELAGVLSQHSRLTIRSSEEEMKMTSVRSAHWLGWILVVLAIVAVPGHSFAQGIGVSITIAPPVLPVYTQPICPGAGYLWTPGYWAWDGDYDDYYWVPGTWVEAPEVGFLWTPGYWGWSGGGFAWNAGYWGPNVGFYGGVNYGFGYIGTGFAGGYWQGSNFYYNTSVMNVNRTIITNTYTKTVVNHASVNRVSYNGGTGGLRARPTAEQERYASERHIPMTSVQTEHQRAASSDRSLRASVNHGRPPVAATARAGNFKSGVVAARASGPRYTKTANHATAKNGNAGRAGAKPSATEHAKAAGTERNRAPAEHASSAHASATHASATHASTTHEGVAKTEPKVASKPAKAEHATARTSEHTSEPKEQKTATHESAARAETKPEPKASKPAKSEHASAHASKPKTAEPKPAAHESAARTEPKSEPKAAKPAKSEHASARAPEPKTAEPKPAASHESAAKSEPKAAKPTGTERAKVERPESKPAPAHAASAPKAEHESAPKAESKPAPAKEEKKPPR
jgi:hypothetical protein